MYNDFDKDLEVGALGEERVKQALTRLGHTVTNTSIELQMKDIDFICCNRKNQQTTLEVKSDFRVNGTGNVYIEISNINNKRNGYKGWYYYCEAEHLGVVEPQANVCHIFQMSELREKMKDNSFRTATCNGGETKGTLVPLSVIKNMNTYYSLNLLGA